MYLSYKIVILAYQSSFAIVFAQNTMYYQFLILFRTCSRNSKGLRPVSCKKIRCSLVRHRSFAKYPPFLGQYFKERVTLQLKRLYKDLIYILYSPSTRIVY